MAKKSKNTEAEYVDNDTGEVMEEDGLTVRDTASGFDALALLNDDLLKKAEKVAKAKDEDLRDTEADFWKPEEAGEELRGVYLATEQGPKYKVHFFGVIDPGTKKPVAVRVNGSTILTREMAKVTQGDGVVVRYEGEGKTDKGNKLSLFKVRVLK